MPAIWRRSGEGAATMLTEAQAATRQAARAATERLDADSAAMAETLTAARERGAAWNRGAVGDFHELTSGVVRARGVDDVWSAYASFARSRLRATADLVSSSLDVMTPRGPR